MITTPVLRVLPRWPYCLFLVILFVDGGGVIIATRLPIMTDPRLVSAQSPQR
jgi:hypothetical protein